MARKIKFALEMADGAKVRGDIDELREHFDLESVVRYFLSGKLVEWLDDRYYEDEAEALEGIDKDAPDFHQKLCEILGVEYKAEDDLDVAALERLNEKKAILRQRTDDEEIIKNADKTALTQEDLADLLDMGETKIYLCGEKFTIPMRVKGITYIGILGKPTLEVRAMSNNDLKTKNISCNNVILPWDKISSDNYDKNLDTYPLVEEKDILQSDNKTFKDEMYPLIKSLFERTMCCDSWLFLQRGCGYDNYYEYCADEGTNNLCINLICRNEYSFNEIIHMCMDRNFSVGFALTYDSICTGGKAGSHKIFYKDIMAVTSRSDSITIKSKYDTISMSGTRFDSNILVYAKELKQFILGAKDIAVSIH